MISPGISVKCQKCGAVSQIVAAVGSLSGSPRDMYDEPETGGKVRTMGMVVVVGKERKGKKIDLFLSDWVSLTDTRARGTSKKEIGRGRRLLRSTCRVCSRVGAGPCRYQFARAAYFFQVTLFFLLPPLVLAPPIYHVLHVHKSSRVLLFDFSRSYVSPLRQKHSATSAARGEEPLPHASPSPGKTNNSTPPFVRC